MLKLLAIVPKRLFKTQIAAYNARQALSSWGDAVVRRMATYPAAQPWKNPPRTGLRAGGARTGNYGRSWRKAYLSTYGIEVSNPLSYAPYVGGPRRRRGGRPGQTRNMRVRGWPSIDEVAREELKRREGIIIRAIKSAKA